MQSDVNDTNTAASPEERGGDLRPMLEGPARPELRAVGGDARAGKAAEVSLALLWQIVRFDDRIRIPESIFQ